MRQRNKITVVAMALALAMMGTGVALYDRMSNQVKATVTMGNYPLVIEHSPHDEYQWTTGPLIYENVHRLDNLIIDFNIKNEGLEPINTNLIIQVNSEQGFTFENYQCMEFDRLFLAGPDVDLMDYIGPESNNESLFFEVPINVTHEGFYPWLDMTFSDNASGSYEILVWAGHLHN